MAILRILVESYRDGLSVADNQGDLPAGLAAYFGWTDAVEYLLEQYPLAANHTGGTAKHMAASKNVAITELICQQYPASIQVPSDGGFFALHDAVANDMHAQAKLIWAAYPEAIAVADADGDLPIHVLCVNFKADESSYTDMLRFLVRHHAAGVSIPNNTGDSAYSVLCSKLPDKIHAHRILLHTNPDLDMATYRLMNYEAR
jgi:ankyrin repeat protein